MKFLAKLHKNKKGTSPMIEAMIIIAAVAGLAVAITTLVKNIVKKYAADAASQASLTSDPVAGVE